MGQVQRSRLKSELRKMTGTELVARTRNRASVHRLHGHASAALRLRDGIVASGNTAALGDITAAMNRVDGYIGEDAYEGLVRDYGLVEAWDGNVTLRTTGFDVAVIERLATADSVLAALDLAKSLDTRERTTGLGILNRVLEHLSG